MVRQNAFFRNKFDFYKNICYNIYVRIEKGNKLMKKINDFDTEIQSDEIGACEGMDWINDIETNDEDEFVDD